MSGAGVKFKVTYIDGTSVDAKARPITHVAAEREFGGSLLDIFERRELGKLHWLAWHACTLGRNGSFDDWLAQVDEIEVEAADAVDPSRPVPSGTPSA